MSTIQMKQLDSAAVLPVRASTYAAGYDLTTIEEVKLLPGGRFLAKTGLSVELPNDTAMLILPRSGLALKQGITVLNSPGLIDPDYRGQVHILLFNTTNLEILLPVGTRVGQALFVKFEQVTPVWADDLSDTTRGQGGFGSTGI